MLGWLLVLLLMAPLSARPIVLVIDPGHGDRAAGGVMADPGASAESLFGTAWECVFTWDTAMRLRAVAQRDGAQVFLTLEDPEQDYAPHAWRPDAFPTLDEYAFKTLVDVPAPRDNQEALSSRVATANRVYEQHAGTSDVYFLSFHFDSTAPDLAGISFYYPPGTRGSLCSSLEEEIRSSGRARSSLSTGWERGLSQEHGFAVLTQSLNPNSYLIELGNIRSCDGRGGNPDLWRMRSPEVRQEYAELVWRAIQGDTHEEAPPQRPSRSRSRHWWALLAGALWCWWLFRMGPKGPGCPPPSSSEAGAARP